jgi:hypothetical protein
MAHASNTPRRLTTSLLASPASTTDQRCGKSAASLTCINAPRELESPCGMLAVCISLCDKDCIWLYKNHVSYLPRESDVLSNKQGYETIFFPE